MQELFYILFKIFFTKTLAICESNCYNVSCCNLIIYPRIQGGAFKMAKCEYCGKDVAFGIKVSHSHRRSNRTWKPNVKRVKAVVNGSPRRVYACTRCLRSGKVTRAV